MLLRPATRHLCNHGSWIVAMLVLCAEAILHTVVAGAALHYPIPSPSIDKDRDLPQA